MRVGCSPAATRPPGNLQSAQPAAEKQAARVQVVAAVVAATQAPATTFHQASLPPSDLIALYEVNRKA